MADVAQLKDGKLLSSQVQDRIQAVVSAFNEKSDTYDSVNKSQNDSLSWLVATLEGLLTLGDADVYTHGAIGYKQKSEGSSASWKRP